MINFSFAQTSVVQDTKGETGLAFGNTGIVAINAKDESISFSFGILINRKRDSILSLTKDVSKIPRKYIGFSAKAKGKNGLANVFKNDEFQYDGNFGAFYFTEKLLVDGVFQFHTSVDFLFNQFKLYDSSASIPFNKQVFDKNKSGYKFTVGGNIINKLSKGVNYLVGLSLNGGAKNNTGDLKAFEVSNSVTQTNTATLSTRIIQKDKSSAYSFYEYRPSVNYFNVNIDFGTQIFKQIFVLAHPRWSVQAEREPQFNPAAGIYIGKSGSPSEIVAGFQVQVLDWYNAVNSDKSRAQRTVLNIIAGFSF